MLSEKELREKESEFESKIKSIESGKDRIFSVIDGIIDIDKYLNAKLKILWVLKDANYGKSNTNYPMTKTYREFKTIKDVKHLIITRRMMLVSHKILNDIEPIEPLEAFKSIACINIKKLAGGSKSEHNILKQEYEKHKDLILEQISVYDPKIIIFGDTLGLFEKEINFRQWKFESLKMGDHNYYFTNEKLYINAYHPSFRSTITEKKYCDKIFSAYSNWLNIVKNLK
jgi:hypothetical protein